MVSEELITVLLNVEINIHNKEELKPIEFSTINNINAPIMNQELVTA